MRVRILFTTLLMGCDYAPKIPPSASDDATAPDTSATTTTIDEVVGGDAASGDCRTFASAIRPVLEARCTSCHSGADPDGGLDLEAAPTSLVNVASGQDPRLRVAPGDPDASYLIAKLEGTAGTRMPLGGAALPAPTIATFRAWIAAGAPDGAFGTCDPTDPVDAIVQVTISGGTITTGEVRPLTLDARDADDAPVTPTIVTWRASDPLTAYVDDGGNVLGVRAGSVTITAEADGVASAPATLTVTGAAFPDTRLSDILPMLERGCVRSGCHIDGDEAGDLRFDRDLDKLHEKLVNEEAETYDGILVRPNDPARSFLFMKLALDAPPAGARMPYGGGRLAAEDAALVLRWISSGARM